MACHKNDKIYDSLSYEIRILIFVGIYIYILLVVLGFGMSLELTSFVPCDLVEIREEIMKVVK